MLDGRQYRSDQPLGCTAAQRDPSGHCPDDLNPARTMLGAEQRDWLLEDLATTKARWNVLAQQTGFAPFNRATDGVTRNFGTGADSWDGYVAERQQILDWVVEHGTPNPVVLTGDTHQNWVRNVPPDFRSFDGPPVATEFMGTSISTNGDPAPQSSGSRTIPTTPTPVPEQQPGLRALHTHPGELDERVPGRLDRRPAAGVVLDTCDLRDRGGPSGARAGLDVSWREADQRGARAGDRPIASSGPAADPRPPLQARSRGRGRGRRSPTASSATTIRRPGRP